MMISQWPYSNMHQLNLDWILTELKKFNEWVEGSASEDIKNFINDQFNNIMINASYNAETETLTLFMDKKE